MANTITDFGGLKSIVMSGALFARAPVASTFTLPDWTSLKLGIRFRISDTGANLTGTPLFSMGFSLGHSAVPGDVTPTHFVGCRHYSGATWTRSVTTATNYNAGLLYASKNVGGVWTNTAAGVISGSVRFHTVQYKILYFRVTRVGTTYTLNAFYPSAASTSDVTSDEFYNLMGTVAPVYTGHTSGSARTLTVDEGANGALDHVAFHWSHASGLLEIADMAVRRNRITA